MKTERAYFMYNGLARGGRQGGNSPHRMMLETLPRGGSSTWWRCRCLSCYPMHLGLVCMMSWPSGTDDEEAREAWSFDERCNPGQACAGTIVSTQCQPDMHPSTKGQIDGLCTAGDFGAEWDCLVEELSPYGLFRSRSLPSA